ncbi:MAG: hypothetical protein JJLCMIEE_01971 [Acidimicrobiales bacterium]|nr:MAG: murein L,D-transpeptidase [Actinomycetota bacterium]MBV6508904.1 hypothetical protein [Acidimicrobiales bacterium]RIK03933.1 MAG: L,D-transpeptidase [Acidobacteriota bacterium]
MTQAETRSRSHRRTRSAYSSAVSRGELSSFTRAHLLLSVAALSLLLFSCSGEGQPAAKDEGRDDAAPTVTTTTSTPSPTPTTSTPSPTPTAAPEYRNFVAEGRPEVSEITVYDAPAGDVALTPPDQNGARTEQKITNPNEHGVPAVFLVEQLDVEAEGELWHEVYLPVRPNGSKGWIRGSDVEVEYNDYRIVVELGEHMLTLYERGEPSMTIPVGVGTQDTPTPGGVFYIKELLQPVQEDSVYGDYAYGLSGYSNVLDSFNGTEAIIGIHGTNDPSTIGADVSHGCIRMTNENIGRLVQLLPLGVPVEILP